jgi:hypothetical protein
VLRFDAVPDDAFERDPEDVHEVMEHDDISIAQNEINRQRAQSFMQDPEETGEAIGDEGTEMQSGEAIGIEASKPAETGFSSGEIGGGEGGGEAVAGEAGDQALAAATAATGDIGEAVADVAAPLVTDAVADLGLSALAGPLAPVAAAVGGLALLFTGIFKGRPQEHMPGTMPVFQAGVYE